MQLNKARCSSIRFTIFSFLSLIAILTLFTTVGMATEKDPKAPKVLTQSLRYRVKTGDDYLVATRQEQWKPKETAIIVCDMWNYHHSFNATNRVAELAPRMNRVLEKARSQGVLIIHAPSSCMAFYKDHPARKRAQKAPKAKSLPKDIASWCSKLPKEDQSAYPIDQTDGGADDDPLSQTKWHAKLKKIGHRPGSPWTRQIATIKIDKDRDVITDNGVENWNVQEQHGIKNVIVLGVHTNMCVLGRPFGLRQMAINGRNVVLMRDMTDTMYNPARRPFVNHFTGTDLIVEHIEKYICPTVTSNQILGDKLQFTFKGDRRKHLVIIAAEKEYKTVTSLPKFAKQFLANDFRVSYVNADSKNPNVLHGLEAITSADLLLVSVRRRALPKQQLAMIQKYIKAGKPVVGIRTASHAFDIRGKKPPQGHEVWSEFDRDVLGGNYTGHHGNKSTKDPLTFVIATAKSASHPIMKGITTKEFKVRSWLYKTSPLGPKTTVLMTGRVEGRKQHEPVTWTNTHKYGGKSFYTSLGHASDFEMPEFQRLLVNGIYWSVDLPCPKNINSKPGKKKSDRKILKK